MARSRRFVEQQTASISLGILKPQRRAPLPRESHQTRPGTCPGHSDMRGSILAGQPPRQCNPLPRMPLPLPKHDVGIAKPTRTEPAVNVLLAQYISKRVENDGNLRVQCCRQDGAASGPCRLPLVLGIDVPRGADWSIVSFESFSMFRTTRCFHRKIARFEPGESVLMGVSEENLLVGRL